MRTGVLLPDGRILCEGDIVRLCKEARGALFELIGDATGAVERCHAIGSDLGRPAYAVHVRWGSGPMAGVGIDHLLPEVEPA